MEFLIVSKAPLITDIPKVSPQQRVLYNTSQKRQKPKPKISLSLDTLTTECDKPTQNVTKVVKLKKRRKARKSNSISRCNQIENSPQKVSKYTKNRHNSVISFPNRSVPTLNKPEVSPYKLCQNTISQPITFSPDKIIKRAISNIMCRSVTSNPLTSKGVKTIFTPNCGATRPPRSNPYVSINTFNSLVPYGTKQNSGNRNVAHKKRIYLSDTHNPGIIGFTAGRIPPLNSPIEMSHSIELVPSLGDARSQVCLQKELRALESKRLAVSLASSERERAQNERRISDEKLRAKSQFRSEIYALNKAMRELEETKYNEFQSAKV